MSEITITEENFDDEVLSAEKPVLIDFWATWCGPCKMIAPVIGKIAEEHSDKIKVGKVNVDEQFSLAHTYGVTSIPTLIFFEDGEEKKRLIGFRTKEELEEELF